MGANALDGYVAHSSNAKSRCLWHGDACGEFYCTCKQIERSICEVVSIDLPRKYRMEEAGCDSVLGLIFIDT